MCLKSRASCPTGATARTDPAGVRMAQHLGPTRLPQERNHADDEQCFDAFPQQDCQRAQKSRRRFGLGRIELSFGEYEQRFDRACDP